MESYYVLNQRIPHFPLQDYGKEQSALELRVREAYQIWLKEKIISNLHRRKVNASVFNFIAFQRENAQTLETTTPEHWARWMTQSGEKPTLDFGEFLIYLRKKNLELRWIPLNS